MFSARLMAADEAQSMGLINFVTAGKDIEAESIAYAQRIAGNAPLTVRAAKSAINAWEQGARPEDLDRVREQVSACFDSQDYKEGRRAFKEKRTPDFLGR